MISAEQIGRTKKPYLVTLREYSASTTIHGISYLFDRESNALDKVFWAVVVLVAIYGATKLSAVAYIGWQDDPVITSIGTTGLPIEKVKFPSITICGQGTAKEIVDAALFKQFNAYLEMKNKVFSQLSQHELYDEGNEFLKDMYPGALMPPNKLVAMMASPGGDSEKAMKAAALFHPDPEDDCVELEDGEHHNMTKRGANEEDSGTCPDGWLDNEFGLCIYYHSHTMAYDDASQFCSNHEEGGKILEINDEDYESIYGFMNLEAGKNSKSHYSEIPVTLSKKS